MSKEVQVMEGFAFSCIKLDNKCADAGIVSGCVQVYSHVVSFSFPEYSSKHFCLVDFSEAPQIQFAMRQNKSTEISTGILE